MAETPRIVVGVDGSEDSKAALRWAVQYAQSKGAEIVAVAAPEIHLTATLHDPYTGEDYIRDTRKRLDRTLDEVVGADAGVSVTPLVVGDRAARALTESAAGADLLVIGSHGIGELPWMHIGSTANYCIHHSPCPVVVLRSQMV
jgi:nucleotide-binding universal stress UspA family protein